jgi:hypothetical protein
MGLPLIVGDRGRIPVQGPAKRRSSGPGRQKLPNEFNKLRKFLPPRPASLAKSVLPLQERASGEMAEWLKAHAWKACVRETVPWVRIPLSPPFLRYSSFQYPIVRIHREITEEPCDVALILRESCSFFAVGFGGQISREGRRTSRRTASSRPALSPASCRSSGSGEPSAAHSPNPVRFKPASVILTTSVTHDSNFVF